MLATQFTIAQSLDLTITPEKTKSLRGREEGLGRPKGFMIFSKSLSVELKNESQFASTTATT